MRICLVALLGLALVPALVGCGSSGEASTTRTQAMSADDRIQEIEKRTDMPEDVKQRTIAGLRASQKSGSASSGQ